LVNVFKEVVSLKPSSKVHEDKLLKHHVARQPILNIKKELFAYELLYRDSEENVYPINISDEQATSRLFFNTLMLVDFEKLTAKQRAFINLSTDALLNDFPKLLNPADTVIEIVERASNISLIAQRVKDLKKDGYVFALDDYDGDVKWLPLLKLVTYVKLEIDDPIEKTNVRIKELKCEFPDIKIIVERIETYEQFKVLEGSGCDYFQGYFFARPEMVVYSGIEPSKVTVFELLRCTAKEHLCFEEVHQRVAKDVAITARILKLANFRIGNANLHITSIPQAVVYLGEDTIRQFVRVLALSELGLEKPSELTKLALMRAQSMLLILKKVDKNLSQQGYLVGLFSVLDAILDAELSIIIKEFTFDSIITDALLFSKGSLGECLKLVRLIEKKEYSQLKPIVLKMNSDLTVEDVYSFTLDAMLYSDEVLEAIAE
jgi:EAL and modified HD-GYP domain-containing signal transduction protein